METPNKLIDAYVLKTLDYKEHSKLMYMYTKQGIQSAIARGVKKMHSPLRHCVQTGMLLRVDLSKGKLPTLKDAEMVQYYQGIKTDLIKTTIVSVINELIYYNVTENDDHQKMLKFLHKVLNTLNTTDAPKEVLMIFELKFLYFLGYGIRFEHCGQCHNTTNLYFDSYTSMVLCKDHVDFNHHVINETAFAPLKYYLHVDILTFKPLYLSTSEMKRLNTIIEALYETHLSSRPKAKRILNSLD